MIYVAQTDSGSFCNSESEAACHQLAQQGIISLRRSQGSHIPQMTPNNIIFKPTSYHQQVSLRSWQGPDTPDVEQVSTWQSLI